MQEQQTTANFEYSTEDKAQNHKLAMTVAIISWSMLFATLLLGYFVYRYSQTLWPPLGVETVPLILPNLSLIAVLGSSITFWLSMNAYKKQQYNAMRWWNWATLVLGLAYVFTQIKFWQNLNAINLFSSSNIFGSIIHGFTWIHAGHMLCALLALGIGIFLLRKNDSIGRWFIYMSNVSVFWHFLTVVWLVLYFTLFIF